MHSFLNRCRFNFFSLINKSRAFRCGLFHEVVYNLWLLLGIPALANSRCPIALDRVKWEVFCVLYGGCFNTASSYSPVIIQATTIQTITSLNSSHNLSPIYNSPEADKALSFSYRTHLPLTTHKPPCFGVSWWNLWKHERLHRTNSCYDGQKTLLIL